MADNALRLIVRLRQLALDQARESLGAFLRAEEAADVALQRAEAALDREWSVAALLAGRHAAGWCANWVSVGRKIREDAVTAQARASGHTRRTRTGLAAARAAREAAEDLLSARESARKAVWERREQLALEEAARNREEENDE